MTLTKLTGVLLAVLLVATGVTAALPGNAPADSHAGEAGDHPAEEAQSAPDEHADDSLNRSDDARADDDVAVKGPTVDGAGSDVDTSAADEAPEVPGDVPQVELPEAAQGNGPGAADRGANATDNGTAMPPVDMPEQVPDFVSEIHQLIRDFHAGDLAGSLGEAISDVTGAEGDAAGNTTQREMPNPAPAGVPAA